MQTQTAGTVTLAPGTLYRVIKQLLADGWITELEDATDAERRRYYRLTSLGHSIAAAAARRLNELVNLARQRRLLPSLAPI